MESWFKETKQGLKCDYIWLLGVAIETNFSKNTPERSIELTGPGWKRDQLWKKPLDGPERERDGTHFCSFFGVHVFSKAGRSRSPKLEREREEREYCRGYFCLTSPLYCVLRFQPQNLFILIFTILWELGSQIPTKLLP